MTMHKCLVCGDETTYFFSKEFTVYNLGKVDYLRCKKCGFVFSKQHIEMSDEQWGELNKSYHRDYIKSDKNLDDPGWITRLHAQANVLNELLEKNVLYPNNWLDYGSGDGKLSSILKEKHNIQMHNYDLEDWGNAKLISEKTLNKCDFSFVITTSVYEHLRTHKQIVSIGNYVSPIGTMAIHTSIGDSDTMQPNWYYLLPVHCAFFTNASMDLLFKQWGFTSCIYNEEGGIWFMIKHKTASDLNLLLKNTKFTYKVSNGFLHRWIGICP